MDREEALTTLREFTLVVGDEFGDEPGKRMKLATESVRAAFAELEARQWRPIETCPEYRNVLFWCPEGSVKGWTGCAWRGSRRGDEYSIAMPGLVEIGSIRRIHVTIVIRPTHWCEDIDGPTEPDHG